MSIRKTDTSLGRLQSPFLHEHAQAAHELPPPTERWTWSDVDIPDGLLWQLSDRDLISKETDDWQPYTWRTPRHVHDYITSHVEKPEYGGTCKHSGIKNLGDGEYTCSNPDCPVRFGRDEAREVIGR